MNDTNDTSLPSTDPVGVAPPTQASSEPSQDPVLPDPAVPVVADPTPVSSTPTIPIPAPVAEPVPQPVSDTQPEAIDPALSASEPVQQVAPVPETISPDPDEILEVTVPSESVRSAEEIQVAPTPEAPVVPSVPHVIPVPLPVQIPPTAPTPPATAQPQATTNPQPTSPPQSKFPVWDWRALLIKAREKIQFRKKARLEKIMKLATEKQSISNDQVQLLLRVSDSTARNYLKILIKDGRLRAVGSGPARRFEHVN